MLTRTHHGRRRIACHHIGKLVPTAAHFLNQSVEPSSRNGHPSAPTGRTAIPETLLTFSGSKVICTILSQTTKQRQTCLRATPHSSLFVAADNAAVSAQSRTSIHFALLLLLTFHGRTICTPNKKKSLESSLPLGGELATTAFQNQASKEANKQYSLTGKAKDSSLKALTITKALAPS